METNEMDFPGQQEGFNAKLLGIESIIEKAMQKNGNLTLNFFLSPVGQHVEKTESAHVWMKKEDGMECQTLGKNAKSAFMTSPPKSAATKFATGPISAEIPIPTFGFLK